MTNNKKKLITSNELFRFAISIGSNIREAINAQNKSVFIPKLPISRKECDETLYGKNYYMLFII